MPAGSGKLYHPNLPPNFDEPRSWSEPWPGSFGKCPCGGTGFPPGGQASCEGLDTTQSGCDDDKIVLTAVTQLQMAINGTLGNGKQPFFIAAGMAFRRWAAQRRGGAGRGWSLPSHALHSAPNPPIPQSPDLLSFFPFLYLL